MYCNLKSYQSIQLRTLNPYRASNISVSTFLLNENSSSFYNAKLIPSMLTGLVFSEYLLSGQAPSIKEVNDEEPLFPAVPFLNLLSTNRVGYFFSLSPLG